MNNLLNHSDIVTNIEEIISILKKPNSDKDNSLETEKLITFIRWFLLKKNKFLVYVGAGGSKDINMLFEGNPTNQKAKTHNWQDLLKAVYEKINNKKEFLKVASARVGVLKCLDKEKRKTEYFKDKKTKLDGVTIEDLADSAWEENIFGKYGDKILQEVLNKLGPFNFAWCLRWFVEGGNQLENTEERDRILSAIVNETIADNNNPKSKNFRKLDFKSALLEEVIRLPFREIITTNYDHYLEFFLRKNEKRREFYPIYSTKTLVESFQTFNTQLYYLHGKASASDNLVLDKYDYAQLFARNRQLLDHLVRLFLRYGILYVGFGLDDQTFSYMGSQMRILCSEGKEDREEKNIRKYIPLSYAFMRKAEISRNEINALAELYNIEVIKFQDFPDIPKVLENVNSIVDYVGERKIDWLRKDSQISEVQELIKSAADKFLEGNLRECLEDYRKALAHTLFWTVETEQDGEKQWEKIQIICEIRRNLTLTRSKLRWTNDWNEESENYHIRDNFDSTRKILQEFEKKFNSFLMGTGAKVESVKEALVVEKVALKMLDARVNYQKGSFNKAVNEFEKFALEHTDNLEYKDSLDIVRKAIRKGKNQKLKNHEIRLLETYYFAQCQFDRTSNIFSNDPNQRITEKLVKEIESIHKKQWTFFEDIEYQDIKEEVLSLREFGTIVVIAKWGLAFGNLRNFSSFSDISSEDKRKTNFVKLDYINKYLEEGWDYAKCLNDYDNHDEAKNKRKECLPSPRWETVKHRSRSRALSLIWFNDRKRTDALTDSYKSIQKALELTNNKDALEIQHIRNLLEAVRLNIITNFSEVYIIGGKDSSMCFAASYHYLRSAFKVLEELLQGQPKTDNPYIWWILIQAYETGCFWRLVFKSFVASVSNDTKTKLLNDFMNISTSAEVEKYVVDEYKEFGKEVLGNPSKVNGRINSFRKVLRTVTRQKKLQKNNKIKNK